MALLIVLLVRRFLKRRRASDAVVALVVAVLLVGGLVRAGAGSGVGALDCRCLFSELTSRPPYSTPQGFAAPAKEIEATEQIPAAYMRALNDCRIT